MFFLKWIAQVLIRHFAPVQSSGLAFCTCSDVIASGCNVGRRQFPQPHDRDRRGVASIEDSPSPRRRRRRRCRQRRRQRVDRPLGDADADGQVEGLQVLQRVQRRHVFWAELVVVGHELRTIDNP